MLKSEILVDAIEKFKKTDLNVVVGMTFNPIAWEALKVKYDKISFDEQVYIAGLPCYILKKQQEECIGWYSKEALDMWVKADINEHIIELPELKSKGST